MTPPDPTTTPTVQTAQCRVGKLFRITWSAKKGNTIAISSDQEINSSGKVDISFEGIDGPDHLDVAPTILGSYKITITATDASGKVVQSLEDDVTVIDDSVLIPGSTHDASGFNRISMTQTGSVHLGPPSPWSWAGNGCGPAQGAAMLRWCTEQGKSSWAALKTVVSSTPNDPREYWKIVYPQVMGDAATPQEAQKVANTTGMVNWMLQGANASCDFDNMFPLAAKMAGLQYRAVKSKQTGQVVTLDSMSAWLKDGPIIVELKKPAHHVMVHGYFDGKLWVVDPDDGGCVQAALGPGLATGVGAPDGAANPARYLAILPNLILGSNFITMRQYY